MRETERATERVKLENEEDAISDTDLSQLGLNKEKDVEKKPDTTRT